MQKLRMSVAQLSDGSKIECFKCKRILSKDGTVYFAVRDIEDQDRYFCFWDMENWLVYHSENNK